MVKQLIEMDSFGAIGNSKHKNGRPWKTTRESVEFFEKETLLAKNVFMSKHTFDLLHSLTNGKMLPDRTITILSKTLKKPPYDNVEICRSPYDALGMYPQEDIIIVGGKKVFETCLPITDEIIISKIQGKFAADCYIDPSSFLKHFNKKKRYIISKAKPHITAQYYERK